MSQFHLFFPDIEKILPGKMLHSERATSVSSALLSQTQQSVGDGGRQSRRRALLGVDCVRFTGCGCECGEGHLSEQPTQHKGGTKNSPRLQYFGPMSGVPRATLPPLPSPIVTHSGDGCAGHSQKRTG